MENSLLKQLEDKKKGCGCSLRIVDLGQGKEIFICNSKELCKTCKSNIAILEQAITEIEKQRQEILGKEIKMQCLICGYSLQKEILDKKIHIHFCKECRLKELDRITNELNQPKEERKELHEDKFTGELY